MGADANQKEAITKKAIAAAKAQLQILLDSPLPDSRTFNSLQKQRARVEHRGGKIQSKVAVVPRAGRKGGKKGAVAVAPVVDNSWKRRGSFFVFAK